MSWQRTNVGRFGMTTLFGAPEWRKLSRHEFDRGLSRAVKVSRDRRRQRRMMAATGQSH